MKKTKYFSRNRKPDLPGVYLSRSVLSGNSSLTWWRAFDGTHWHAGIMAVTPAGFQCSGAPSYDDIVKNAVIGDHVCFEWCGLARNPNA